ncbi:MAG TPA: Gfo/Idh/MocA family oxidoreductase [Dongiaceae bacterium]|nr:Gfo/Idh/MocA family oxidoreductase [Dongiaceae bacterium]
MNTWTRRDFAKSVILAGATTALGAARAAGAAERVRLGFIGVGNRGDQVLDAFLKQPDAEVAAVSDLSQAYMDFAASKAGTSPRQFKDYRRLLELKDLDAVVVATPDHWHALMTIEACQAGKDVYVEKPLSLRVLEGRRMVEAVRRHGRVCQVGIHRRSVPVCQQATEFVRQGGLGKITAARAFHIHNEWPAGIGHPPDGNPPADFDWDAWLGPAPQRPYNKNRSFYRFRWFYDYSGGQVTNFGVHYLDFIQWALGAEAPLSVTALGGKVAEMKDNREIPDTLEAVWQYPGGTLVTFSQFNATAAPWSLPGCEIELRGTLGTLYLHGDGYEIVADPISQDEFPALSPLTRQQNSRYRKDAKPQFESKRIRSSSTADTAPHARNFLDCVKSRAKCNCDVEIGHRSTSATLLANIALKTRSLLDWDAQAEQFPHHPEANQLLKYDYRPPYRFPEKI